MKDFKQILENIGKDVLADEHKTALVEAFDGAVNEKTEARVKLEVEDALKQLDEDHASKIQTLVEAIDKDHTNKFKKAFVKVDADYGTKLQKVVEHYEKMLKTEAVKFREQLVSEISNFMDLYIDKVIPKEQIQEAVNNARAKKVLENVKKIVGVDEDFINENVKSALEDGKGMIDDLRTELHEAMKANIRLNQEFKKVAADKLLIEKTMNFDEPKKKYVMRVLAEKSPEEIEANFDYVLEMAEREEDADIQLVRESATKEIKTKQVDTPKSQIKTDIIEESVETEPVDSYFNELQRL